MIHPDDTNNIEQNPLCKMDTGTQVGGWMSRLESLPLSRSDMNTLVMDYLVTEGYKDAAQLFMLVMWAAFSQS